MVIFFNTYNEKSETEKWLDQSFLRENQSKYKDQIVTKIIQTDTNCLPFTGTLTVKIKDTELIL